MLKRIVQRVLALVGETVEGWQGMENEPETRRMCCCKVEVKCLTSSVAEAATLLVKRESLKGNDHSKQTKRKTTTALGESAESEKSKEFSG